jgi:hypothetical protein
MCDTDRANRAWNAGGAGYFHVGNGWRNRNDALYVRDLGGTDDTDSAGYSSDVHDCQFDGAALAVRDTSYIVYYRFSRLDGTGGVDRARGLDGSGPASSGCACRYRIVHTDAIDGANQRLHIHGGQRSHDDIDRDDARDRVGDYSHAIRRQHDRDHIAGVPARQPVDYRVQHYAGRTADQRRRFAALDPRSSEQSPAWRDSTHSRGTWRHQHRSDNGRDADAKYVGMRREHDDESGDARHDGGG